MSLIGDIIHSYRAPRAVMRKHLARGRREDRALVWLLSACLLIFVAQWPRLARQAHLDDEIPFAGMMAGALFGWLFLAPLIFYALAGLVHLGRRMAGQRAGDGYAARLVIFWSLLAVTPLWMLHGLLAGALGPGVVTMVAGLGVLAVFVAFVATGLREAVLEPPAASA